MSDKRVIRSDELIELARKSGSEQLARILCTKRGDIVLKTIDRHTGRPKTVLQHDAIKWNTSESS